MPSQVTLVQTVIVVVIAHLVHRIYVRLTRESRLRTHFRNRHVWVIGASQGLGRALCERLHELGARLTISSRSKARLAPVSAICGDCHVLPLDITSDSDTIRTAWNTANQHTSVDDVIANAGINHQGRHFSKLHAADIDRVLDTNLRGVVHLFHAAIAGNKSVRTLCAMSSLAAYRGLPGSTIYSASKAALSSFCTSLNIELLAARSSSRVVAVHPGFVDTPAIRHLTHPKPFIMSEQRAADLVLDAMACGNRHYGFPWIMEHIVLTFSNLLPSPLYEHIMCRTN